MYDTKDKNPGPHYGFGTSVRPPLANPKPDEPGPNHYELKPHFADVPKYLMNAKH